MSFYAVKKSRHIMIREEMKIIITSISREMPLKKRDCRVLNMTHENMIQKKRAYAINLIEKGMLTNNWSLRIPFCFFPPFLSLSLLFHCHKNEQKKKL